MNANPNPLVGRWRITAMSQWEADDLDLVEPAFIEFGRPGSREITFHNGDESTFKARQW
jgi:hypothetical protein